MFVCVCLCVCACVCVCFSRYSRVRGGGCVAQPDGSHCVGHAVCAASQLCVSVRVCDGLRASLEFLFHIETAVTRLGFIFRGTFGSGEARVFVLHETAVTRLGLIFRGTFGSGEGGVLHSHCVGHAVSAASQLRSRAVTFTCLYSVFVAAFLGKKHTRHEHRRAVALSLRGPSRAQRAFVSPNPHFVATLEEA